jgi:hypothetical protein
MKGGRPRSILRVDVLAAGTGVLDAVLLGSAVVPVAVVVVGAWLFLRAGRRHDERERRQPPR